MLIHVVGSQKKGNLLVRFFIVGNASSVWIKEYVKQVHIKNNHEVYLTVFDKSNLIYKEEYDEMGVKLVFLGKNNSKVEKIRKFINLFIFACKHKKRNLVDIIEIQGPPHNILAPILGRLIRFMNCKAFIMFWGSDILAIPDKGVKKLEKVICEATLINRPGLQTYKTFVNYYGYKYEGLFTKKSLRFGTLALQWIDKKWNELGKSGCKNKLGIDVGKTCIAIGYNGNTRHQHIKVLEILNKLSEQAKAKIHLLFHFVGCENESYKDTVTHMLEQSSFSYTFIEKQLNFDDIAILRLATDIFIHAQVTDGLSGSIRECLYSGVTVVNPYWIQYDELKKLGADYIEYETFDQLKEIVNQYMQGNIEVDANKNKKIIYENYAWDALSDDWIKAFDQMML